MLIDLLLGGHASREIAKGHDDRTCSKARRYSGQGSAILHRHGDSGVPSASSPGSHLPTTSKVCSGHRCFQRSCISTGSCLRLWILLLLVQTTLIAARRTDLHRRLGIGGGVLAVAMIAVGTAVAVTAAKRGPVPGLPPPLEDLAIPLGGLVIFAVLVGIGFLQRRRRDSHKRLMVLATIVIAGAGLDRLLFPTGLLAFSGLPLNTLTAMGLTAVFVTACCLYDLLTRGRVHPAFLWGGLSGPAWGVRHPRARWRYGSLAGGCRLAYALTQRQWSASTAQGSAVRSVPSFAWVRFVLS